MSNFKSSLINDLATARLGQPGGFAKLDENGLVTSDQLPAGSGGGSLSWVEGTWATNAMNPFASIPDKLDSNSNPYVWRFSNSGAVSLDGTSVIAVTTHDRIWYHISSDTWFHEKQPPSFSGASLANAGYPGLVPLAQQSDGFRSLHGNGQFLFPHQFANTYPAPYINVIYVGQGLLAKQGEIYELSAEAGDRNGIRITPYTDWADVDLITAQSFSGNAWTVVGQPTSGKQECFVVPDYDMFVWEFKTSLINHSATDLQGVSTTLNIYIDNVNGINNNNNPSNINTPCKTFEHALSFIQKNYYFEESSNALIFWLLSDYSFEEQESYILDGKAIKGFPSLYIYSYVDNELKTINANYKKRIVIRNFSNELKFNDVKFEPGTDLLIENILYITNYKVEFFRLIVNNCQGWYDSEEVTIAGATEFNNIYYVDFHPSSIIKAEVRINNAYEINFGGVMHNGNSYFFINNVYFANLLPTTVLDDTLTYFPSETSPSIFDCRNIQFLALDREIFLDSSSGYSTRRFFDVYNSTTVSYSNLKFAGSDSISIENRNTSCLRFNNCKINNLKLSAASSRFNPFFTAQNDSKKLLELVSSNFFNNTNQNSLNENTIKTELYGTSYTARFLKADLASSFFLENNVIDINDNFLIIYIDNINGDNFSTEPSNSLKPVKTLKAALEYAQNRYRYPYEDININFVFKSDYTIDYLNDVTNLDGKYLKGFAGLKLSSFDENQKIINPLFKRLVIENFNKITFERISFGSNSELLIQHCDNIDFTGLTIFNDVEVKNCKSFFNSNGSLLFLGTVVINNLEYAEFVNSGSVTTTFSQDVKVSNVLNSNINCILSTISSSVFLSNIQNCIFNKVEVLYDALGSNTTYLLNLNNIENIQWNVSLELNATSAFIYRPLLKMTNCFSEGGLINFKNKFTQPLFYFGDGPDLIQLINCSLSSYITNASGGFVPCFTTNSLSRKLLNLEKTRIKAGTSENDLKLNIFNITDRPIKLDKYSDYLENNIIDNRGKIKRVTITGTYTLSLTDVARQHITNNSGSTITINLPTNPFLDLDFLVINSIASTNNLNFNSFVLTPGNKKHFQWDGVEWVPLN